MDDFEVLNLEPGEGVMRQSYDIWSFDGEEEHGFDYFILTNKNIILFSENTKIFGKTETIVKKIPLGEITNVAQVDDEEYGNGLRIYYKNGKSELYTLNDISEKDYHIWVKAINDAICSVSGVSTEPKPPILPQPTKKDTFKDIKESSNKPFSVPSAADPKKPQQPQSQPQSQPQPAQPQSQPTQQKPTKSEEPKKCPHCGETLDSFVAICPACGHEISNESIATVVEQFISNITACERNIANNAHNQTGWASWSKNKKIGWVILNILFSGIPLAIYLILPLVFIKSTPQLTTEEKQLASLIENFNFPNDRASILSALIFTKEKIDFISKEKIDRKSAYWMRLWCAKAEQLKQKADMLFPNDDIVNKTYAEITADDEKVKKTIKMKAIFGIVLSAIIIVFSFIRFGSTNDTTTTDDKDYSATFEWQTNGLFAELPKPNSNNGRIVRESADQIQFEIYNVSSVDFDEYVKSCRETGFTVDLTKTDSVFYAHNEEGYDLKLFYDDKKDVLSIHISSYDLGNGAEGDIETTNKDNGNKPSNNKDDKNETASNTTVSLAKSVVAKSNDYIKITEVGYTMVGDFLTCIITITNPSADKVIEVPSFRVTAYDEDGKVLGSEERVLSIIYPNQKFVDQGTLIEVAKKPDKIEVTALVPDDYNIIDLSEIDHPTHTQMVGKNISVNSDKITGEISNPNNYKIESAMVTVVFRDSYGTIVSSEFGFVDQIPANGTVPFDIPLASDATTTDNVEVFAYIW